MRLRLSTNEPLFRLTSFSPLVGSVSFGNLRPHMLRSTIALAILSFCCAALGAEKVFDFLLEKQNETPSGFRSALFGTGQPGEWKIIMDDVPTLFGPLIPNATSGRKRPVLAQLSRDRTDERFPMLIYTNEVFGDFTLTTRFKLVAGEAEQMAGIAFRIQDERNYYYVRASGLGNTFYFFKIVDGQRGAPIGNKAEIPKGVWHEMTIECKATRIRALLNGKEIIPWLDDKSFIRGNVGYWTKSDSVTYFADTTMVYKPQVTLAQSLVKDAHVQFPRLQGLKIYAPVLEDGTMRVIASLNPDEVGQPAPKEADDVLAKQGYYYGKEDGEVMLTLPLRDNNGEKVAAVCVVMKSFFGQTQNNALARAMPVVKGMEARIQRLSDLMQ